MDFQKVAQFHGHSCPGLTIGYRAAILAAEKFAAERASDEELVAIVESDGCGIDAIQAVLGCTIGKGNLIYQDKGKQVYTIASRGLSKALRLAFTADIMQLTPSQQALRAEVFSGKATVEQVQEFRQLQERRMKDLMAAPIEDLFKIEWIDFKLPEKAKIFNSAKCGFCGENVMEPRARLRDGQIACLDCAENYSRGW